MVHYSILIPERGASAAVARLLPPLCQILKSLILPYELICIDDASGTPHAETLEELLYENGSLRVLRFDQPRGTSAALSAGIAAARGELIITIDPHARCGVHYLPHLIARLSQHDLVTAQAERSLGAELAEPFRGAARLLARGPYLRASEDLFWAARREAVNGLALASGAFRVLPELVMLRGFRVCQLTLAQGLPPRGTTLRPNLFQRLATRWLDRRYEPHLARELYLTDAARTRLRLARLARVERSRSHFAAPGALSPQETFRGDSA